MKNFCAQSFMVSWLLCRLRTFAVAAILLVITACALPPAQNPEDAARIQSGVSRQELVAVSLAREATDLYARSRFIDAEVKYLQALYLFPDAPNVKASLAAALEGQGRHQEARVIYEALVERFPKETSFKVAWIRTALRSERRARGEQVAMQRAVHNIRDEILSRDDQNRRAEGATALTNLGVVLFRAGMEEMGSCLIEEALFLESTPRRAVLQLEMFNTRGLFSVAAQAASKYLGDFDLPELRLQFALALLGVDSPSNALEELTQIVQSESTGVTYLEAKALSLIVRNKLVDARPVSGDMLDALPTLPLSILVRWPYKLAATYQAMLLEKEAAS